MTQKTDAKQVDAFMRQIKLLVIGLVAVFAIPLVFSTVYLDRRIDSLQYRPPQESVTDEPVRDDLYHLASNPVEGQVVYVPAYSHVYHGKGYPHLLTITLSIRNTSLADEIVVKSVRYFDTKGAEVKSYFAKPFRLAPMETTEVLVEKEDATGGSGANFLVEWYSDQPVTEPIIEAVMIDTSSQQGISFARRGSVISEVVPKSADDTQTLR